MDEFELLLDREKTALERFVRFRISPKEDADDVLQEIYLAACRNFNRLKNANAFKAWLLSIARNKCNDYFRKKASTAAPLVPTETADSGRFGFYEDNAVEDTLELLRDKDKQILRLFYWEEMSLAEIADKLHIPAGTAKSRMHAAKQNFKNNYPYQGGFKMKKLPGLLPEYTIEETKNPPFPVKWEELPGWFIVPKPGEQLVFGIYDIPSRRCDRFYEMRAVGKAKVHGLEGVEITATEITSDKKTAERTLIAQLTDTRCRYLATFGNKNGMRNYLTFLDGEEFMLNWGLGEDNCGNETDLRCKNSITRNANAVDCKDLRLLPDIMGRYTVTIGGKRYDTVCVLDTDRRDVFTQQFLDKNGKTVLWRTFDRGGQLRSEKTRSELPPENERLIVNGETYVHWYDCITDFLL